MEKFDDTMRAADQMVLVTPEDYVYKGWAESRLDPERGLQTMEEALRRRPTVIGYLHRAEAEAALAEDHADLKKAQIFADAAIKDGDSAKRLAPGNPFAHLQSMASYQTAARIYGATQQPARRDEALALAREDAFALRPVAGVPVYCVWLWTLLRDENIARCDGPGGAPAKSVNGQAIHLRFSTLP